MNVKKRGLPEGYVRGLEKLWGIAIKEIDTIEDHILTALAGEESNESPLNVWNDESKHSAGATHVNLLPHAQVLQHIRGTAQLSLDAQ